MAQRPAPTPQPDPANRGRPQPGQRPQGSNPQTGTPQQGYTPPRQNYAPPPQNYPPPPQQGYAPPPQNYPPPLPQNYGPSQGYSPPGQEPTKKRGGLATAALVLGIIGFVLAVIPFVNFAAYPVVILAIVFGLFAFRWGKGKAGLILGVLGLVATILWTAAIAGAFDDAVNKPHTVVYRVIGTGKVTTADVSYYSSDGSDKTSNISHDGQALPFTKQITVKGDLSDFELTANTPIDGVSGPKGTLSCSLSVDGKIVSRDRSSGSVGLVNCSGIGYDGN